MQSDTRARILSNPAFKVVRWTLPWVVLAVILYVFSGYWSDFQRNKAAVVITTAEEEAMRTTSTVEASGTPVVGVSAVALIDGVRLRAKPAATAQILASVGKGTKLTVLEEKKDWLRVRDPIGHIGWITSSAQFVEVTRQK
jgi:uncharacterized protein YgiM (DUF1202 family)